MKAVEEKFLKFIQTEAQFKIPIYQRLYSWEEEHCRTLMEDLKSLLGNPKIPIHFMGSVVYIDEVGFATLSSTRELLVIDGQQRLTTFTLIFIILEAIARKGNRKLGIQADPSFADKIRENCLVNKYSKLQNKNKLILTKSDNTILEKLLLSGRSSIGASESRLIANYDFLKSAILSTLKTYTLDQFFDNLNKLMIVDVALFHDIDNPQQTFESLNATGKELEEGDLIRNFLLMNLTNEKQTEIYEKYWYPLETSLEGNLTYFIYNYLYMEKGTSTNIRDLYKEFRIHFYSKYSRETTDKLAQHLLTYAQYFNVIIAKFADADGDSISLRAAITSLSRLNFDSYIPLLLPLYHEYKIGHETEESEIGQIPRQHKKLPVDDLIYIVRNIESFLVRRSVCDVPTNSLNTIFRTLWGSVDKENIKDSLLSTLKSGEWNKRFPDDDEFRERLKNNTLYGKNHAKIILENIEGFENKEANTSFDAFQIEHILPKTDNDPEKLSAKWREMLGEKWKEVRNTWVHKLGNLTLTGYNPELSDKDFDTKKTMDNGFLQSTLRMNQAIAKYKVWNEESILDRSDKLIEIVLKIWAV